MNQQFWDFFAENQQISNADHDFEGIIRQKTLLPKKLRDTAREIGFFWRRKIG